MKKRQRVSSSDQDSLLVSPEISKTMAHGETQTDVMITKCVNIGEDSEVLTASLMKDILKDALKDMKEEMHSIRNDVEEMKHNMEEHLRERE